MSCRAAPRKTHRRARARRLTHCTTHRDTGTGTRTRAQRTSDRETHAPTQKSNREEDKCTSAKDTHRMIGHRARTRTHCSRARTHTLLARARPHASPNNNTHARTNRTTDPPARTHALFLFQHLLRIELGLLRVEDDVPRQVVARLRLRLRLERHRGPIAAKRIRTDHVIRGEVWHSHTGSISVPSIVFRIVVDSCPRELTLDC